jgi:glc operon protein GlcG
MQSHVSLGLEESEIATQAIREELARRGRAAVIAIADAHGELISLVRLDGAPLASIVIATNKAWTAARERKPTRTIGQSARDPETGFDIAYYGDRRYVGWGGGLPVVINGAVVGSVAVSGLPELEDMELAEIGVAAITAQAATA